MKPTQLDASLNSGFIPPENGYSNFRGGAIVDRLLMFFSPLIIFHSAPTRLLLLPPVGFTKSNLIPLGLYQIQPLSSDLIEY